MAITATGSYSSALNLNSQAENAAAAQIADQKTDESLKSTRATPAGDTVAISGEGARFSAAEVREQARLARIGLLEHQKDLLNGSGSQTEREGEDVEAAEDPEERFRRMMYEMMEARQVVWNERAAEQAAERKEEEAALLEEQQEARKEEKAGEKTALAANAMEDKAMGGTRPVSPATAETSEPENGEEPGNAPADESGGKASNGTASPGDSERMATAYGKRGAPVRSGNAEKSATRYSARA